MPPRGLPERAAQVRRRGLVARLGAPSGPASLGVLEARGPDAASFLHGQLTNDVTGLPVGGGNLTARVDRKGHLLFLLSLHRLAPDRFWLLCERDQVPALQGALEEYLFSDDLTLTDRSDDFLPLLVTGPEAPALLGQTLGRPSPPWEEAQAGDVFTLTDVDLPEGTQAVSRSLTGDPGFVLFLPRDPRGLTVAQHVEEAARRRGWPAGEDPAGVGALLDLLRIEAGYVRVGPDTAGRPRLLPETGLENELVSYTKGCYLGQEVIARVRTYGSLPYALRGLLFAGQSEALLGDLPPPGARLELADGTPIGHWASRAWAPAAGAPLALAYLGREHREPGRTLTVRGNAATHPAQVVLLPVHRAGDRRALARSRYDRAIQVFAAGREGEALALLEEALRLDPGCEDAYEAVGVILGRQGRYHEAIDFFRRLGELAPEEPLVHTNLSLFHMKLGDREAAENEAALAMAKSLARSRGEDAARAAREEVARRRRDAERKKAMFSQVLELDPKDPVALFGLGNAHAALEEWAEAAAVYHRALEVDPKNSALYLAGGKALERLDRPAEALALYRRGIQVASRKGDLMPLKEMEQRARLLAALLGEAGAPAGPSSPSSREP